MDGRTVGTKLENLGISKVVYYSPSIRSRGTILGQVELRGGRAGRGTWGVRGLLTPDYIRRDQTTHIVWRQIVFFIHLSSLFPISSFICFPQSMSRITTPTPFPLTGSRGPYRI